MLPPFMLPLTSCCPPLHAAPSDCPLYAGPFMLAVPGGRLHVVQRALLPPHPGLPVQPLDLLLDGGRAAQAQQQGEDADECGAPDPCGARQVSQSHLRGIMHVCM